MSFLERMTSVLQQGLTKDCQSKSSPAFVVNHPRGFAQSLFLKEGTFMTTKPMIGINGDFRAPRKDAFAISWFNQYFAKRT